MTYRLFISTCALFWFSISASTAQYVEQATLFSQYNLGGTARVQALGGPKASLGGDLGSIVVNPAGLGFYNRSELSISPSMQISNANAQYLGQNTSDTRITGGVNNFGIVFHFKNDEITNPSKWHSNFSINYTKTNNFFRRYTYDGLNTNSDLIDYAVNESNRNREAGVADSELTTLTYEAYLIEELFVVELNGDTVFFDGRNTDLFVPDANNPVRQLNTNTISGSQSLWNLAYGGNYDDRLYFGVAVGIAGLNYINNREYEEQPTSDLLRSYTLSERREINGIGINATLGIIYRPIDAMTVGVSYSTPTAYALEERFSRGFRASWNNYRFVDNGDLINDLVLQPFESESPFEYALRTPQRLNGSASYFFGKNGFLSANVEWVNYSSNQLNAEQNQLGSDNNLIPSTLGSAFNFNVGGEWRYNILRVRGGYARSGNPYTIGNLDASRSNFSGGVGLRFPQYYLDLAVVNTRFSQTDSPYVFPSEADDAFITPVADISSSITNIVFTLGFNF